VRVLARMPKESVTKRVYGIRVRVAESVTEELGEEVSERQEQRVSEFEIIGERESVRASECVSGRPRE
jgi:hypothetical protein